MSSALSPGPATTLRHSTPGSSSSERGAASCHSDTLLSLETESITTAQTGPSYLASTAMVVTSTDTATTPYWCRL